MTEDRLARLLRPRENPRQVSFLELFVDLAMIFAFVLLSQRLVNDLSWLNAAQTMVLLGGIWWIWVATAWATDWFNPNAELVRGLVLGIMLCWLIMITSVPTAFGSHGVVFAGAYVAVHLGRGGVLLWALRGHQYRFRSLRVGVWFCVTGVVWLVGAFLPPTARLVCWVVALTIDFGVAALGWPTPGLRRARAEHLRVGGEHLAERYRQVFIIGLGEIVLVSGIAYRAAGFHLAPTVAFLVCFGQAALLLGIYFMPVGNRLSTAIDQGSPRVAVAAAHSHAVLIAGVVLIAVGDELLIVSPFDADPARSAPILAGSILFLIGRIMIDKLVFRRPVRGWVVGLLVTLALAPVMVVVPALGVAVAANLVLMGTATVRKYRRPAGARPVAG